MDNYTIKNLASGYKYNLNEKQKDRFLQVNRISKSSLKNIYINTVNAFEIINTSKIKRDKNSWISDILCWLSVAAAFMGIFLIYLQYHC